MPPPWRLCPLKSTSIVCNAFHRCAGIRREEWPHLPLPRLSRLPALAGVKIFTSFSEKKIPQEFFFFNTSIDISHNSKSFGRYFFFGFGDSLSPSPPLPSTFKHPKTSLNIVLGHFWCTWMD